VFDDSLDPARGERLRRAARAAQALSQTLWEALQEELTDPRPKRVAELSEQLVAVPATIVALARSGIDPSAHGRPPVGEPPVSQYPTREPPVSQYAASAEPLSAAVLVDELAAQADVEVYSTRAPGRQAVGRPG
jgi:hypothetical protein